MQEKNREKSNVFNELLASTLGFHSAVFREFRMNSPTELSPRGGGVHIYFMAAHTDYSKARYYINNHDIGLEVYPSGESPKYLTVTGRHVDGTPADISGDRSAEIMQVLEKYMVRSEKSSNEMSD